MRGIARTLGIAYNTVNAKFLFLCRVMPELNPTTPVKAHAIYFDELETIEHTKCKPLTVAMAVTDDYKILSIHVGKIPAKGKLASFSVMKYGKRPDESPQVCEKTLTEARALLVGFPQKVVSDAKPSYKKMIKTVFPESLHEEHCRADRDRQQSRLHEKLQKKRFDPMFVLNQRCAKLRSHVRRLTRRSWCTTKLICNLQLHLNLFKVYNNTDPDLLVFC